MTDKLVQKIASAIAARTVHCLKSRGIHDAGGEFSSFIANSASGDVIEVIARHLDPNQTCPRCSEPHDQPELCNWCRACSATHDDELSRADEGSSDVVVAELCCDGSHDSPACTDSECWVRELDVMYAQMDSECGNVLHERWILAGTLKVSAKCALPRGHEGDCK